MNLRIQQLVTTIIATQIATWLGWLAAWGWVPGLGSAEVSLLAGAIASVVATVMFAVFQLIWFKIEMFVAYVGSLADDPKSPVAGVVMKTDAAAEVFPQDKVVGPTEKGEL